MSIFIKNSEVEKIWTELKTKTKTKNGLKQTLLDTFPANSSSLNLATPGSTPRQKRSYGEDRFHKRWQKSEDDEARQEFESLKRLVQNRLRRQRWKHVEDHISDEGSPASSKTFWSFIKARRTEEMGVSPLKDAGKLLTNPKEQAQLLNNQFRSVFSPKDTITAEEFEVHCPPPPGLAV